MYFCYYEKIENSEPILLENLQFEVPDSWVWARLDNAVIINPRNNIDDNKEVSFVEMKSIQEGFRNSFIYESRQWRSVKSGFTHFQNNDVGFAKITPCFQNRKSCVFKSLKNGYGAVRQNYIFYVLIPTQYYLIICFGLQKPLILSSTGSKIFLEQPDSNDLERMK